MIVLLVIASLFAAYLLLYHTTLPHPEWNTPLRSRLITSLYSAFICSAVFTEPTLRPSFPPFSIYRFLPDCNRNEILSRSNCAQAPSNGFPSSFVPFYFLSYLMLIYSFITDYQAFNLRYKVIQRGTKTRQKWVNNPLINFKKHFMAI